MTTSDSITGLGVRKRIKEVTHRAKDRAKEATHRAKERLHPHEGPQFGPKDRQESEAESAISDDVMEGSSVNSSAATVKIATTSREVLLSPPETTTTPKEEKAPLGGGNSDLIGIGLTSVATVPLLAMMIAKDDNGISVSTTVSIPILLYGMVLGLMAGVLVGRASKDREAATTSVPPTESAPPQEEANAEAEAEEEPMLVSERSADVDVVVEDHYDNQPRTTKKNKLRSATKYATKLPAKITDNVKELIHQGMTVAPWTALSNSSQLNLPEWQRPQLTKVTGTTSRALMNQIHHMSKSYRKQQQQQKEQRPDTLNRQGGQRFASDSTPPSERPTTTEEDAQRHQIGRFDVKEEEVATLEDVIVPAMKLRGLDVFIADEEVGEGQTNLGEHPYLLEHGLRDTPTLMVNMITGFGNHILYLQLPSYVTQLHDLVEEEDDDDEVKAVKRFINGDDEYRNDRLKVLPSVAEAPFAIRVIAPAKKEVIIHCMYVPCSWRKHEASVDPATGKQLHPLLEVEVDCMSDKWVRSIVNLCVKHTAHVIVDVGLVIQLRQDFQDDPEIDTTDEPEACIGMFRMAKVDMHKCPALPPNNSDSDSFTEDELRASRIVGVNMEQLREMAKEHKELGAAAPGRYDANRGAVKL